MMTADSDSSIANHNNNNANGVKHHKITAMVVNGRDSKNVQNVSKQTIHENHEEKEEEVITKPPVHANETHSPDFQPMSSSSRSSENTLRGLQNLTLTQFVSKLVSK